jgi:Nickel responsive protein SCO4226-like
VPLFMDVHQKVDGATAEAVASAHVKDLEVQGKYGVSYQRYWVDESAGRIFCLVEAPDKEAAIRVHREAHGLVADEISEVVEGS